MLGILTGIQAAVSIGGAIAGHIGGKKQAKRQDRNIQDALRFRRKDLTIQGGKVLDEAAQGRSEAARQAEGAQGRARAAGASGGVSGASVDAVGLEISGDLARVYSSIQFNMIASLADIDRAREAAELDAQAQHDSVERPSLFNTLARMGSGVLDTYSIYKRFSDVPGSSVSDPEER